MDKLHGSETFTAFEVHSVFLNAGWGGINLLAHRAAFLIDGLIPCPLVTKFNA